MVKPFSHSKLSSFVVTVRSGVNDIDSSFVYFSLARGFSVENSKNNSAKCVDLFNFLTDSFNDSGKLSYNFEIKEDLQERLICQSTITPQVNPADANEQGFVIDEYGSLSANYWDQLMRANGNLNESELITDFKANTSGVVTLKTSLNSDADYFSTVDLIVNDKTYNLERSDSSESRNTNGIYLSPSIESGLEIYSLLSSGQPFSFKVIERPITISSGLITPQKTVINTLDTIGFIDGVLGSYTADNRSDVFNPNSLFKELSVNSAEARYFTNTSLDQRPLLREVTFNNEFTITLLAVEADDNREALSTSTQDAVDLYSYLEQFEGQQIPVRVVIQDTPWTNPLEQ